MPPPAPGLALRLDPGLCREGEGGVPLPTGQIPREERAGQAVRGPGCETPGGPFPRPPFPQRRGAQALPPQRSRSGPVPEEANSARAAGLCRLRAGRRSEGVPIAATACARRGGTAAREGGGGAGAASGAGYFPRAVPSRTGGSQRSPCTARVAAAFPPPRPAGAPRCRRALNGSPSSHPPAAARPRWLLLPPSAAPACR